MYAYFGLVNEMMQFSPANLMRGDRSISGWVREGRIKLTVGKDGDLVSLVSR